MKESAWVRSKMGEDGLPVEPRVYELLIGHGWGAQGSRVVSEHNDKMEAARLADFFNKATED